MLVLGRNETLASLSQIPVIPLSSQIRGLPWEVQLSPEDGMAVVSVLKAEWIRSVDRSLLGPWITEAVLLVLGLDF